MSHPAEKPAELLVILGDQLFPNLKDHLGDSTPEMIFMAEAQDLASHFKYHKQKLIFFFASMRRWAKAREEEGFTVQYHKINEADQSLSFTDKLEKYLKDVAKPHKIKCFEIDDHFMHEAIEKLCADLKVELEFIESPKFLFKRADFSEYLNSTKKPFLKNYYQRQREALKLLLDENGDPLGGKWSFDESNRKKLPKDHQPPMPLQFEHDELLKELIEIVDELFPDHPGKAKCFNWATSREQALAVLEQFLNEKFELFGPYEDALEPGQVFLYHSTLSPYLNIGLLEPREVLEAILEKFENDDVHYPSVEGFVRQLVGWREFISGMYHEFDFNKNYFGFSRKMKKAWYEANTGIPPLDDSINKVQEHGYNHHIERLMVLGNIMLMCELDPQEVYAWFMEMYIDSADWVMAANVMGMSQFADGGSFATKPYIAGSNYLRKMSHYPKGEWCDIVDGLYWRFIDRQRETFASNHRMGMMLATLKKMDPDRKERIFKAAENWIESVSFEA